MDLAFPVQMRVLILSVGVVFFLKKKGGQSRPYFELS
jgi:hypothetical protein